VHQAVRLEPGVRRADRVDVDPEIVGERADGGQPVTGRQLAVGDLQCDPGVDLGGDAQARALVDGEGRQLALRKTLTGPANCSINV
jgi:hypothetical protein